MEMTIKKNYETRRRILAVVLFFGMSAATVQVFAAPNDIADGADEREANKTSSGVQISGTSGTITQSEDISSRSNAVEFSGAFVRNFNLSSKLTGGKCAIYIDGNSLVRNINIYDSSKIFGDIVSARQAESYSPDRVTNLNINTDFIFDGNISGAESIKLHVNDSTMKFSGEADILSVDVGYGAQLFGGTFRLNNMNHKLAEGVMDTTTGTFINHGTIGAGSPETNLVINGNLISDGILQKVSGGKAGIIIVNGNANVNGSTVTTDSLLPNETATVLIAKSVTGRIKNSADNPYPLSAMLSATGEIVGNSVVVKTYATTNEEIFTPQESETFTAMKEMFERLDDDKRNEMRPLYNMTPPEAKRTLTQIGSNDAAQIMSVAQQNVAVDRMISHRVSKVFAPEHVNINVHPMKFADGEDNSPEVTVKVKVPSRQENNFWINYMKNWGQLGGNTDYHGSVIVGGYDRPIGRKWRAGIFATYGTIGYGAKASRATVYDTRLGLYAGYHNRQSDVYLYLNGGQLRNSLHRGIYSLGLSTNANYKSRIIELGGEYKYDFTPKKLWHVSPFVNFQVSHLKQNAYNESGAGIYNQHVAADSNTYFAAQTGLDLKRYYKKGMVGLRFGVKRGFTGADPDLRISYEGDTASTYRLRQERDKTHFVFSVRGESEFANGWFMGGEAELQRGENDRDVTASVMLRRIW
ncbi:MAG: autotransporter outer membrane beta-barrel domain-containing protein [Selenomonadaceae bacterium]|nr:autotransporter outer membrane beta-barrel domain-containing protein [Selenomonadaceae bacterium]